MNYIVKLFRLFKEQQAQLDALQILVNQNVQKSGDEKPTELLELEQEADLYMGTAETYLTPDAENTEIKNSSPVIEEITL